MRFCSLLAATLATLAAQAVSEDSKAEEPVYEVPSKAGLHWADTFDGEAFTRWTVSEKEKYKVKPEISKRKQEGLIGDVGLLMPDAAQHYGVSASFPELAAGRKGETFIVQYEAKFQDGLQCGGGYIKLFNRNGQDAKEFDNDTPYLIMFGPDRCGATDKVHFILQHQNPKTLKWEEKHFKDPPSVPRDENTHLFGLVIRPDNTFDILIDGQSKASGNLLESMDPPLNPPKEIDDPEDSKPEDWIDEPKMPDPESSKPDDWDEDEPRMIIDPDAKMPEGWLEDQEKRVADPSAKMPADWDEDEDGEWEAPMIDNPACAVGCGKWQPPKISNPKYKGKWSPPMIDNPSASNGTLSMIIDTIRENPIPAVITTVLLIVGAFFLACRGESAPPAPASASPSTRDKSGSKSEGKQEDAKETKKKQDDSSAAMEKPEEQNKEEPKEKPKEQPKKQAAGGVGLDENDE